MHYTATEVEGLKYFFSRTAIPKTIQLYPDTFIDDLAGFIASHLLVLQTTRSGSFSPSFEKLTDLKKKISMS